MQGNEKMGSEDKWSDRPLKCLLSSETEGTVARNRQFILNQLFIFHFTQNIICQSEEAGWLWASASSMGEDKHVGKSLRGGSLRPSTPTAVLAPSFGHKAEGFCIPLTEVSAGAVTEMTQLRYYLPIEQAKCPFIAISRADCTSSCGTGL